jgi:purine-binding chemotaxis protein CheW
VVAATKKGVRTMQLVVFALGAEEYALPIHQVQEIIRYREPRRVSGNGSIRGVINLRSRIIPVCDLAGHLGATSAAAPEDAKIVIIDADGLGAGVMVDGVNEVMTVEEDTIERDVTSREDVLTGIAKVDDRLIILIDPAGLLTDLAITRLKAVA